VVLNKSLFIFNFKIMKKIIKNLTTFILIFIIFNHIVAYFYELPMNMAVKEKTHMKYLKWTDIESDQNEYDLIFLGSSRGYCAYNPIVTDSILSSNSYNMCTVNQDITQSYFILKEILKYQTPSYIVYEMFLPSFPKQTDFYPVFSNAKFMSVKGKIDMIVNGYGVEGAINLIFPILKHKNYIRKDLLTFLFNRKEKNGLLNQKQTKWIKGFCYNELIVDTISIKSFSEIYSFDNTEVSSKKISYFFNKFVSLCKENNIKLICVRAPYPPTRLNLSNDTAGEYFSELCEKNKILFFDFNYTNSDEYIYTDQDFADYHHMNCFGAQKVTTQLSEIIIDVEEE